MATDSASYKYTILAITQAEQEQALEFLKRTFFPNEPVNQGVGLCLGGERCPQLEEYCLADMLSGFSLRAVDEEGNIVAVVVSGLVHNTIENYHELVAAAESCTDVKFEKILRLLAQRELAARLWEKYPEGCSFLEVKVAATDPGWGKRGLMTAMVQHTERLARAHNIPYLRMDTSSAYSARVAAKLGFTCVSTLLYRDVLHQGLALTSPPAPHVEDAVWVKTL